MTYQNTFQEIDNYLFKFFIRYLASNDQQPATSIQ